MKIEVNFWSGASQVYKEVMGEYIVEKIEELVKEENLQIYEVKEI